MKLEIHDGPGELANRTADRIADLMKAGCADIGLAGGSTPTATYEALARRDVDWSTVDAWLSDERWTDHDSDESNGAMAASSLVDRVTGLTLHRPHFDANITPAASAEDYEARLREFTDGPPGLVLLGMGTDGHIASLFPGTVALANAADSRWFVANHVPQLDVWRLTVTPHLLRIAAHVIVIVSGSAKASVLAEALERPIGAYPIELLHEAEGQVTVMADTDAASHMTTPND